MRIERLELTNFRCFAHEEFVFAPGFNVFVGDNGTGKTAALDAIARSLEDLFVGLKVGHHIGIEPSDARLTMREHEGAVVAQRAAPVVLAAHGVIDGARMSWDASVQVWEEDDDGHVVRFKSEHAGDALFQHAASMLERVRAHDGVTLPLVAFYRTGRLWPPHALAFEEIDSPGSRLAGYVGWPSAYASTERFTRWFKTRELEALQEGKPTPLFEAVREAVRGAVPGCVRVQFSVKRGELVLHFDDGRLLPFGALSDGVRNICALFADVAYRMAVLNPQLGAACVAKTPGVVLVDELDLHLHPQWQRRVVEDLRNTFSEVQFFTTTHSPFVIQSLREGELIELGPREPHPYVHRSIEDIAEGVMGVAQPQRSERFRQMVDAAKRYYRALDEARARGGDVDAVRALKAELDGLMEPFRDDPAYVAYLEYRRELAGVDDAPG